MKFKFKHADKIVGLFTLIALVLLVIIAVFAGVNKKWFTKKVFYRSLFTSAEGLKVGMGVNLRGFEIGRVRAISLNADNQVDIVFYIYEDYHDRVRPDSVVALPSSLLGAASALEFYPGLAEGYPLPDGTLIPSTQTVDGKMLVKTRRVDKPESGNPLDDAIGRLPDILGNIDETIASIGADAGGLMASLEGKGDDDLASSIRNIEGITANVKQSTRDLTEITADLAALTEDPTGLVPTLLDPEGSLATLLDDDDELWNRIMAILGEVEGAVSGVNDLAASLSGVSPQLALALDETIRALEDAQKVMEGLRNNPLLRKGISPETPPENPGTDTRAEEF